MNASTLVWLASMIGVARGEPAPPAATESEELAPEPITQPWHREPDRSRPIRPEVYVSGSFLGMSYADKLRYHAFVRFGIGVIRLPTAIAYADLELARTIHPQLGAHALFWVRGHSGFTVGVQTTGHDIGASGGACWLVYCLELRSAGAFSDTHVTSLAITVTAPFLTSMSELENM